MTLAQGDAFVVGDIFSFQQAERIRSNWRAVAAVSNPQAGSLWSQTSTERLFHRQAAAYKELVQDGTVLGDNYEILFGSGGVLTIPGSPLHDNLIDNSENGLWSRSDASKGLATITYDTGAKGAGSAPSVGDAVVGANGATAKLIKYTIASGTWAGGNAAGVLTVGAVSHDFAFVDNEVLTFDGVETAAVNMPDSGVQVGKLQNGGFAAATSGWAGYDCTLASIAGGQVGNCLEITRTAGALQFAYQNFTGAFIVGKIYKVSVYVKSGTSGNEAFQIGVNTAAAGGGAIQGIISGTSSAAWVLHTLTFEATATGGSIYLLKNTATAGTMLFDEVTFYDITPCCTGADALAFDSWSKDANPDIYREHSGTNTKDGSFYSLMIVPTSANGSVFFPTIGNREFWNRRFRNKEICAAAWVKTSSANHARLAIYDNIQGFVYSPYHTGGGDWEWLEISATIAGAGVTINPIWIRLSLAGNIDGSTIVYISQEISILGTSIGEGNYQPKQQEIIWVESSISSNLLNGKSDFSSIGITTLNIEADSDGKLPKGCVSVMILTRVRDSGSAGADCYLILRKGATKSSHVNSPFGLTNDAYHWVSGVWQDCNSDGDISYQIGATGVGTFDIEYFNYTAVQVN